MDGRGPLSAVNPAGRGTGLVPSEREYVVIPARAAREV